MPSGELQAFVLSCLCLDRSSALDLETCMLTVLICDPSLYIYGF